MFHLFAHGFRDLWLLSRLLNEEISEVFSGKYQAQLEAGSREQKGLRGNKQLLSAGQERTEKVLRKNWKKVEQRS